MKDVIVLYYSVKTACPGKIWFSRKRTKRAKEWVKQTVG